MSLYSLGLRRRFLDRCLAFLASASLNRCSRRAWVTTTCPSSLARIIAAAATSSLVTGLSRLVGFFMHGARLKAGWLALREAEGGNVWGWPKASHKEGE